MFDVRSPFAALRAAFAALRSPPPAGALGRGLAALAAGRFAAAEAELARAADEAPDAAGRAFAHNKRGVALISARRRDAALEAFDAALASDPDHAPALVNVGNLLFEDGDVADAIDYYEAALRADEAYAPAYRNLGVALKRAGRRDASVRALRTADRLEARPSRRRA